MSLPLLAVIFLELVLRLAGYGYTTSFFKETLYEGRQCVIENENFSLSFFPPELARWPNAFLFEKQKPADTYRIFIFGESAAMGDPQPAYGASRYMEAMLRERWPGKKFEVINLGITAINSHVILPIARECARRQGDLWIIYMGNNEMVGPFGAATVFGSRAPPLWMVRLTLTLQHLHICQMVIACSRHLGGKPKSTVWGGMQMFLQNQLPPEDPRRQTVYKNFEENLRDMLRVGVASGAKVVLNTMSVNLKDNPPFASLAGKKLTDNSRTRFDKLFTDGRAVEEKGDCLAAAPLFEQAAGLDPSFSEVQYRWARCLERMSNNTAGAHFQLACDTDALPFRADSHVNQIIQSVGSDFARRGVVLADAESALAAESPNGIPGNEIFFEHVHFNFHGNYLLGKLWAEQVARAISGDNSSISTNWALQADCEKDLCLSPWNRGFVLDSVVRRMSQPPLSSQFNNPSRLGEIQHELAGLRQQLDTNEVMRTGQGFVDVLQRRPKDALLYEGFANFLEAVGDRKQAATNYAMMLKLQPQNFYPKMQLGRLQGEMGHPEQGEPLLQQAAREKPSVPEIWPELGNVQMMLKKYPEALASYSRGLKLRPQDPTYVCYQANALANMDRRAEAISTYRRAIQMRGNLPQAHFELAGLLALDNQVEDAMREYQEAIRLDPKHAISRINLGVMFVRQNRFDDAIQQFRAALQLDPNNTAASAYLQQITAKRAQQK
jgi:tetratricopeptide (TPR) repeat protein